MATSSIMHNFIIEGEERAERFIDRLIEKYRSKK